VKVIIAGGRDFNNYDLLCRKADKILSRQTEIEIVSGTAKGADKLGELYAKERGYKIIHYIPDWNFFGKSAGYIRNEEMGRYADGLIAFWNEKSKGTKHMIDIAKKEDLLIRVITY